MSPATSAARKTFPAGEADAVHRRHVVTALVVDRPGTLNRVSGLLRARSFNIESLTVGTTHEPGRSRMTIAIRGDDGHLRQVLAQLERLIDVLEVTDLTQRERIELELALVELEPPRDPAERETVNTALAWAGGEILSTDEAVMRARLTGPPEAIDRALEALRGHGLISLVRAGAVAMAADPYDHPRQRERSNPGMTKLIYDADIDGSALDGQTVAVIGYGSQGEAHARNLADSGVSVVVGLRPDSATAARARDAGLEVTDAASATAKANVVMVLVPDMAAPASTTQRSQPNLREGALLMFAHGFNIHFGQVVPPGGVDVSHGRAEGPRPPRAHACTPRAAACPRSVAVHQDATRDRPPDGAGLRQAASGGARRRARDHVRRGDRDRPLRRAGRPVRRRHVAGQGGLRDAGRGRLPAGDRLLRDACTS